MGHRIVRQKSYDLALRVIRLCAHLKEQKDFEIANQLLRVETAIGASVEEGLAGFSRRDFAAKMSIASKEAREANYWLRLLTDAKIVIGEDAKELLVASEELVKMLTSIVKTARERESYRAEEK